MIGGAVAGCVAGPSWGRQDEPPLSEDERRAALSVNLLTRMSSLVRVNGSTERPFVIDTGAERTVVSMELAALLALPAGPPSVIHGVTAEDVAQTVRLRTLAFAGASFSDLIAPTFPARALGAYGLLGLDVLAGFRLMLDFRRLVIVLGEPQAGFLLMNPADGRTGTRIGRRSIQARRGRFGQLLLPTEVEGVAINAFVDSGSQFSIANAALLDAIGPRPPASAQAAATRRIYGVTGHVLDGMAHRVSDVRVAGRRFGATDLVFSDLHIFAAMGLDRTPALLIGADILCQFDSVTLDFALSRVAFGALRRRRET